MSIALTLNHVDGLRLRHQVAHKVTRIEGDNGGAVQSGTEWRFEGDIERDTDPRKRDANGAPLILPTYTFHISYGLKNAVIEKKGRVENIQFRNSSLRNQIRIRTQAFTDTNRKDKSGAAIKAWHDQSISYLPANVWGGVAVGDGVRTIIDEMPT